MDGAKRSPSRRPAPVAALEASPKAWTMLPLPHRLPLPLGQSTLGTPTFGIVRSLSEGDVRTEGLQTAVE
jgi:hypothetical protein